MRWQKYYIKKLEIFFCIIIFLLVTLVAYLRFGFPFNIKYEITDGSSHYYFAEQFSKNSELLYKQNNYAEKSDPKGICIQGLVCGQEI